MRKVLIMLLTLLSVLVACAPPTLEMPGQAGETIAADATATAGETAVEKAPGASSGTSAEAVSSTASLAESVLLSVFRERHQVRPVDPATGQALTKYAPIDLGVNNFWPVLAPGGQILAAVDTADRLHLIDLKTWQDNVTELRFPDVSGMAFSPDGTRLALAFDGNGGPLLALVDIARQTVVARVELDFWPRWQQLTFTPDGDSLVVYGTGVPDVSNDREVPGWARVAIRNAADLALEWETNLPEVLDGVSCEENCRDDYEGRVLWQPAVVMGGAADSSIFVVYAHEEKMTVVDLGDRTARSMPIEPAVSWLDRLIAATAGVAHAKMIEGVSKQAVISPDGSRLYVAGWQSDIAETENGMRYDEKPLGLKVIDTSTGREIAAIESEARQIALSADGRHLYLSGWQDEMPWTHVLDTETLEVVTHLDGYRLTPGQRLDGRSVLLASRELPYQTMLALVDEKSYEIAHSWTVNSYATWVTQP